MQNQSILQPKYLETFKEAENESASMLKEQDN